ncbi:hypothetical protein ABEF95_012498 [Exophiala dermatitidis]
MAQSPASEPPLSNLIRLAPLHITDLPYHPDLPGSGTNNANLQPAPQTGPGTPDQRSQYLSTFLTQLLSDGTSFLSPPTFSRRFKHHSTKKSPPASSPVEVLDWSVSASTICKEVQWSASAPPSSDTAPTSSSTRQVSRSTPSSSTQSSEYWLARRSVHNDISSKSTTQPGHASWSEFVFGLRDNHSKNECEFTPSLYDARCVVKWPKEELRKVMEGGLSCRYSNVTMGIYEMCHAIPAPLRPRCFCVLVVTGSVVKNKKTKTNEGGLHGVAGPKAEANTDANDHGEDSFVAVTVPVDLTLTRSASASGTGSGTGASASGATFPPNAFYSSGRNVREGVTPQQRKRVVMGVYAAVETVTRRRGRGRGGVGLGRGGGGGKVTGDAEGGSQGKSNSEGEGKSKGKREGDSKAEGETVGQIEWVMATTSDAKGVLPGWLQRMSVPAAVAKDVGYFIRWIRGVDDSRIKEQLGGRG